MTRTTENIVIQTEVEISYEDKPGAREALVAMLKNGATNITGYCGTYGGFSTRVLGKASEVSSR